jgi:hypothetical protein
MDTVYDFETSLIADTIAYLDFFSPFITVMRLTLGGEEGNGAG